VDRTFKGGYGLVKGDLQDTFSTVLEVLTYLQGEGWKVSQSTLYKHVKDAKLRPAEDGTFALKTVRAYAQTHLQLASTRKKAADEDLQRTKLQLDINVQEEKLKREKLKREAEEGRLIPREDVDLELAARAVVQDHEWTRVIQSRASEIIALVEGNADRASELVRFLMDVKDEVLNEFASTKYFHVLFEQEVE
jgi:hypothetical protein